MWGFSVYIILTGFTTLLMRNVLMPALLMPSSLDSPSPGSSSNSPFRKDAVVAEMCTRLKEAITIYVLVYILFQIAHADTANR